MNPSVTTSSSVEARGSLLTTTFSQRTFGSHRGAAAGPSGMTANHLRPLLESEQDTMRFWRFAQDLARACAPDEVVDAIRLGRLTAPQKPNGGVRGIVVGDIIRRLVARTIAQQLSSTVEQATAPFQHALSTKVGGECIAHALQALTDLDPRTTVLSVDGVGTFDLISRCWMEGLRSIPGGDSVLPFVLQFCGNPSSYLWADDSGDTHEIHQGEGVCLCSLHWASTEPFVQSSPTSRRTNASSLSTMTSTSCRSRSALASCMAFWRGSCGPTVASGSTGVRLRFGIVAVSSPQATMPCLQSPVRMTRMPRFGLVITLHLSLNAGFVFWVLLWAAMHSSGPNSKPLENPMSYC